MENYKFSGSLTGYATIDKPWEKWYHRKFSEIEIPNMSIYQLARKANEYNGKDVAIDLRTSANNFEQGIKITYDKFFERVEKSAYASSVLGIKKDDIVPIILPNVPEARILIYSNSFLGAISYPISPLLPVNQLERIITENEIKNLFLFSGFYEKYAPALKNSGVENIVLLDGMESVPASLKMLTKAKDFLTRKKQEGLDSFVKLDGRITPWDEYRKASKHQKEQLEPFYEDNHVAAIIGTSGTTGMPKGACLTDRNVNTVALAYKNGKIFEGNFLDALLPSIGYGLSMIHYQTVAGKYVYLSPELIMGNTADVLETLKPDNFPGGPVHYINIKASKQFKEGTFKNGKNYISGGASLPNEVEKTLNNVDEDYAEQGQINDNLIVRQGYGLSENVAMGTYSKRGTYKFGSIGIPMPYITIGIFKPGTDEELKYGESGELCITGPSVMKGYLNNQEETDKVIMIHKDGKRWIHTKDICHMDEDGNIFHEERIKNIFMRTGFNVHPSKIAEHINTIPFVRSSAVIGFDHPAEQCVPVAFVELDKSLTDGINPEVLEEAIMTSCNENLEQTSVPYDIVFVDQLPINAGGKIDLPKIRKESEINLEEHGKVLKKNLSFNAN